MVSESERLSELVEMMEGVVIWIGSEEIGVGICVEVLVGFVF